MTQLVRSTQAPLAPATRLRDIPRTCDVDVPLSSNDPRWQDFSPARGDAATTMLARELEWRDEGNFVHAALISHRGAGKSTEILRLTESLSRQYLSVYLEATVDMDPLDIEMEDLLLNLVIAVEKKLRALGTPLDSALIQRVTQWFQEVVRTTKWAQDFNAEASAGAEAKLSLPVLGSLFGGLKALMKHESQYRTEVKEVLRKYPGTLLQSVNQVLDAANAQLGGRSLLVVVDNLDRYDPIVIDKLLMNGADRVRQLRCNLILTPPIGLLLQPRSAALDSIYTCHVLYAIRLRDRKQRYDEFHGEGRTLMEEALARRIDLDTLIPDKPARNL
ncbi:hypothetical protein [Chondromyces crocatus]|uniref:Orc1-like AAA ATPase domain-containing protein n=1 Tax=Chondromyces crocatus TaxID=52 RepID=A0A0K1EJ09_CHOCO|nr:hypothetical protein [Chondromyces crocatus]AKT40854.1 uncharacterized protein CMC5_050090 [Chondromyces crocatus]